MTLTHGRQLHLLVKRIENRSTHVLPFTGCSPKKQTKHCMYEEVRTGSTDILTPEAPCHSPNLHCSEKSCDCKHTLRFNLDLATHNVEIAEFGLTTQRIMYGHWVVNMPEFYLIEKATIFGKKTTKDSVDFVLTTIVYIFYVWSLVLVNVLVFALQIPMCPVCVVLV